MIDQLINYAVGALTWFAVLYVMFTNVADGDDRGKSPPRFGANRD
jgi:hypothetical protein